MQIVLEPQTLSKSAKSEISSHNERIMCWYSVSLAGTQAPLPSMTHARKAIQSKSFWSKKPLLSISAKLFPIKYVV